MQAVAKSQWVRLYNVLVMTPWMYIIGHKLDMKGFDGLFMRTGSVATFLFNFRNLVADREVPQQSYEKIPFDMSTVYDYNNKASAQAVRVYDMFVFGPACMWIATHYNKKLTFYERAFLWYTGLSTIALNGANYFANRRIAGDS